MTELKGQLLAASLRSDTNYDAVITGIGLGVANLFDQLLQPDVLPDCQETGGLFGGPAALVSRRYPVEVITGNEKKDDETDGFVASPLPPDGSSLIQQTQLDQGYIMFIAVQGYYFSRIRITYTGGFWFDTTEDNSGVLPNAATLLPAAVKAAWYVQCQEVWNRLDRLGAQIAQNPEKQTALDKLELAPFVKQLLGPFKRMQIT